jgi:acylphosphatase
MEQIAKHVIFKGRVQGVGFRYTTHRAANRYDLTGYVRDIKSTDHPVNPQYHDFRITY